MTFAYGTGFKPVDGGSRTCFGIAWFATEKEANDYHNFIQSENHTYNGGMFHGMRCGRDRVFDKTKDGVKIYAVTHQ